MSKVPYVERPYGDSGLTGECAYLWACFLANEADMNDDIVAYDKWTCMAEELRPRKGKATPVAVYYSDLDEEIQKYQIKEFINPSNCAQE